MTRFEQLENWVQGKSLHNDEAEECCPDFSCCTDELAVDNTIRMSYLEAVKKGDMYQACYLGTYFIRLAVEKGLRIKSEAILDNDVFGKNGKGIYQYMVRLKSNLVTDIPKEVMLIDSKVKNKVSKKKK